MQKITKKHFIKEGLPPIRCYSKFFLFYVSKEKYEKLVLMEKQMILTSVWGAEHPFAGHNNWAKLLILSWIGLGVVLLVGS